MKEKHREPEVPEDLVPVVKCLDGFGRVTLEELATTHSVILFVQDKEWLQIWGKVLVCARQVEEKLSKMFKKNGDKFMNNLVKGEERSMTKVQ